MRIKIREDILRRKLFENAKENVGGTWESVQKYFKVTKSSLERYISGKVLMPEILFERLLIVVNEPDKSLILSNSEKLPDNHGCVLGGKRAYVINKKKFAEGRKKGIEATRRLRKIEKISFENVSLTPELCEVAGAFIGDGCFNLYKNKLYHVEFSGDRRYDLSYYLETILPIIKAIIPEINPHILFPKHQNNTLRVVLSSKKIFYLLKDFFGFVPGKKAHTIFIPSQILDSEVFIRATVRGIFDTDGCVFLDKRGAYKRPYPRITFQTVSKSLYLQLVFYLERHFKLYTSFNQKRQIYIIEIYGINQVKRWMSLIGFSNRRHLDKLASIV